MNEVARALEAILMVASEPVDPGLLAEILEVPRDVVVEVLESMAATYESEQRGFVLREVGGGWRFYSHPAAAPWVEAFVRAEHTPRLSGAALETMAVIAYKQPVSRAQIAAIRGVNSDGVVRNLVQRGLVAEVARDDGPGQAVLLGTTVTFLEKLGLRGLHELPPLTEFVPGDGAAESIEAALRGRAPERKHAEAILDGGSP